MIDVVSAQVRSRMMSGIKGKNTKPELLLRRGLHAAGFRYRLHVRNLPGKPDIVLPKYRAAIFVHGCFWHGHDCHLFKWPASRVDFWRKKIMTNRANDLRQVVELQKAGWRVAVIWECAFRGRGQVGLEKVIRIAESWIRGKKPSLEIRATE